VVLYVCFPGAQSNPTIALGEKFALPGPNGAGETPLINFSCGIVNPTENFPGAGHYQLRGSGAIIRGAPNAKRPRGAVARKASMSNDMRIGYNKPLYILPFDHRSSFEKGLFGWSGASPGIGGRHHAGKAGHDEHARQPARSADGTPVFQHDD
jgi:hypothetical protein